MRSHFPKGRESTEAEITFLKKFEYIKIKIGLPSESQTPESRGYTFALVRAVVQEAEGQHCFCLKSEYLAFLSIQSSTVGPYNFP